MASDIKTQLGQFLTQRLSHPDSAADEFAPGGVIDEPNESFLNIAVPNDLSRIKRTSVTPVQAGPTITLSRLTPVEPQPRLSTISPTPTQQPPALRSSLATPVSKPPGVSPTTPAARQPSLDVGPTSPAARQPSPEPIQTSPSAFQPGPSSIMTSPSPFQTLPTTVMTSPTPLGSIPTIAPYPPPAAPQPVPAIVQTSPALSQGMPPGIDLTPREARPIGQVDRQVAEFLDNIVDGKGDPLGLDPRKGPYSSLGGGAAGTRDWDARLFAKHMLRLATALGPAGLGKHSAQQLGLFALNRHGRIWNPQLLGPPPVARDFTVPAVDIVTGLPPNDSIPSPGVEFRPGFYEKNEKFFDRHLQRAKGKYNEVIGLSHPPFVGVMTQGGSVGPHNIQNNAFRVIGAPSQDSSLVDDPVSNYGLVAPGTSLVEAAMTQRNFYGPNVNYFDNPLFTIGELVKGDSGKDKDMFDDSSGINRVNISVLFSPPPQTVGSDIRMEYRPKPNNTRIRGERQHDPLEKSYFEHGIVPAGFDGENGSGFFQTDQNKKPALDDDAAYVPLCFTDIRPYGDGKVRTVYFRPFITTLSEELSPEWNTSNGFGRVDPIKTYGGTTRTISLSFIVHAFSPDDLSLIYKKLTWLASMIYPEYDKDMLYKSGPVVRLRIGDLISSANPQGLAGTIDNLSIEYSDKIWELAKDSKVPMGYVVSMGFTVLHDTPIGRGADGKFGALGTIDGTSGLYKKPSSVLSADLHDWVGPEVQDSLGFRGFKDADVDDYDPTE